ncbi:MAG: hypothetical protein NUV81_03375 [bacterium]|nr:hypothetical protein [bacterium]
MRSANIRLPGHPNAICDLLAEAVVDEYLRRDPSSRIRCRVHGGAGALFVSGNVQSSADYDVSRVLQQKLGDLGVTESQEIFVALEAKGKDARGSHLAFQGGPVSVVGGAFRETPERIPEPVAMARRVAQWLNEKRLSDPDWYWLGPDGEVTVIADRRSPSRIHLEVEHGTQSLDDVRLNIEDGLRSVVARSIPITVNASGPREVRGLESFSGSSGHPPNPYGSVVPGLPDMVGCDPHAPEKAGTWLARHVARNILARGEAKAVLVRALYYPGDARPSLLRICDERGREMGEIEQAREMMDLRIVMRDWWRHQLNVDAMMWSFLGTIGLPWEE